MTNSSILRRSIISIVALLVLVMLVVPYVVGMNIEAELRKAEQDAVSKSPYPVTVKPVYFHQGWFSSEARSEYKVLTGTQASYLYINHHVNQLFIPFYRWAEIRHEITHLDLAGMTVPIPTDFRLYTDKLFWGGTATHAIAPSIFFQTGEGPRDGIKFSATNLAMQFRVNSDGSRQLEFNAPTMSITPVNQMPAFTMTNLTFSDTSSGQQSADTTWQQRGQYHLEKVEMGNGQMTLFGIHNIDMRYELKDRGQNVDLIYHTNIEQGQFGVTDMLTIKDSGFDFSYLNISKAGILNLQAAARAMNTEQPASGAMPVDLAAQQAQLKQKFQDLLQKSGLLIASSPSFKIDRFILKTNLGDINGTGEVHLNGDNFNVADVNVDNMADVFKARITGNGSLKVAREIVMHGAAGHGSDPQQQMKNAMLQNYVSQGYVVDDGKTLSMDASFGPNGVDLNGKHVM